MKLKLNAPNATSWQTLNKLFVQPNHKIDVSQIYKNDKRLISVNICMLLKMDRGRKIFFPLKLPLQIESIFYVQADYQQGEQ